MMNSKKSKQHPENEEVKNKKKVEETPVVEAPVTDETANVSDESFESTDKSAMDACAEVQLWKDKYMRLSAEFDNYRKRTLKEKMDLIVTGGEEVIKSLLVVMDDMDRAMAAVQQAADTKSVKTGVELIYQKLFDTLKQRGVAEIKALGLELDTDLHEAVANFPVEGDRKGKIIEVVQKGYKLKDKVVRHSKVVVGA